MHRNTFVLVSLLTIVAAIVVSVNAINILRGNPNTIEVGGPTPRPSPSSSIPQYRQFTSSVCGVSLFYPGNYQVKEEGNSARFAKSDNSDVIALACQKEIPRPPLPTNKVETVTIGTVSAALYHDGSQKDGAPIDRLIFTHPGNKLDVYLAGFGENFNFIVQKLSLN